MITPSNPWNVISPAELPRINGMLPAIPAQLPLPLPPLANDDIFQPLAQPFPRPSISVNPFSFLSAANDDTFRRTTGAVAQPGSGINLFPSVSAPPTFQPFAFPITPFPTTSQPFYSPFAPAPPSLPPFAVQPPQVMTTPPVGPTQAVGAIQPGPVWSNDLKKLFHQNKAIIYAINIRTFGAFDKNNDNRISHQPGENGTFLSAVRRLDELVSLGVNTIHLLPINPIGKTKRFGDGGSLYAPSDFHSLNPQFATPGNGMNVEDEARIFINECHKRGIHVMVDVPSCASIELAKTRPDLILKDANGRPLIPTNWVDIVMFKSDKALQDYFEGFFNLMNRIGVDGYRVDVARSRPLWFWQHFIGKNPDKAWLAETYCEEDQSPLANLPRDIPEDLLRAGFDSIYGQWHIFDSMANATEYRNYLLSSRAMFQRASATGGNDKSFIGSFLTHDDELTLMDKGGVPLCLLASGLMATQPWTNPYMLDGFTTGYVDRLDIFSFVPRHEGSHPEIGLFLKRMFQLRQAYEPILDQGLYIPIPVSGNRNDQIIAFARHANGKTLLTVANMDLNSRQIGSLHIPGLSPLQPMANLAPEYGRPSRFVPGQDQLSVNLGPGRFHVFEINTPNLPRQLPAY
jgi:hypothetical protein